MKPANILKILAIVAILFVPAISYYLITTGKNNFRKLEIFGPKEVASGNAVNGKSFPDTIYHHIPAFSFKDQFGRPISNNILSGKIYIANFFFTSCKTVCPAMSEQCTRIQNKFKEDGDLKLLSFTVDPERDSVPVLAEYAKKYKAKKDTWYLLTGEKTKLSDLARNGFFITALPSKQNEQDFTHSEQFVLVDKEGRIRGYYDGTDNFEISRLMDEILVLEWEYKNK